MEEARWFAKIVIYQETGWYKVVLAVFSPLTILSLFPAYDFLLPFWYSVVILHMPQGNCVMAIYMCVWKKTFNILHCNPLI